MPKRKADEIPQIKRKRESGKRKDRAYVWLDGMRDYLGEYGSRASERAYGKLIASWLANDRELPKMPEVESQVTVEKFVADY